MPLDHSLTYKQGSSKNIPHRLRLRHLIHIIERELTAMDVSELRYTDFGCSNGYLTNLLTEKFRFRKSHGFDHNLDNLIVAREKYPNIAYDFLDMNKIISVPNKYDFITCFETLEHVGNLDNALHNLLNSVESGGKLLITVPIEIGIVGIIKFIIKRVCYNYSLDELSGVTILNYIAALVKGRRISIFRDNRNGWGTHFGFDYRDIDEILQRCRGNYKAFNKFTTRFYIVEHL